MLCRPAPADDALSHADAVALGTQAGLDLLIARSRREAAEHSGTAALLSFVPTVGFRTDLAEDDTFSHTVSSGWTSPIGTTLSATSDLSGDDGVKVTVDQPLLRGGGLSGAFSGVRTAALDTAIARASFRAELNDFLVELDGAYWTLVVAQMDVDIKRRSRDRARAQFEETAENIARGILAPGDIYVVEESLVIFEQSLLSAVETHARAQRSLGLLVGAPGRPVVASDPLSIDDVTLPTAGEAVALGLESSPDVDTARLQAERARRTLSSARNTALPELSAEATLSDVAGAPSRTAGLEVEVPLSWRVNAASVREARANAEREALELTQQEQEVRREIRDQLGLLGSALARHALAVRRLELAELKLEAERERYLTGLSRLSDVVRFQRDLDQAAIDLERVRQEVLSARAALASAQGVLHERLGVSVQ